MDGNTVPRNFLNDMSSWDTEQRSMRRIPDLDVQ